MMARSSERKCVVVTLTLLFSFWLSGLCFALEFDTSYSPLINGSAESGIVGWTSAGAESIQTECPEGSRCFQLTASDDFQTQLRSRLVAVRRGEKLRLDFQLKSKAGSLTDSAYAEVRSYRHDGQTVTGQTRFALQDTAGRWVPVSHEVTATEDAFYVDVRFVCEPLSQAGTAASVWIDAVSVFREISYDPLYADIKPLSPGDSLYVFTKPRRGQDNQTIAIQTLQGVIARTDRPRLWVDAGDNTFVKHFTEKYDIRFDRTYANDFAALLGELKQYTDAQYVLYDMRDKPSISAATTMAGLLDAVAIDTRLEEIAKEKGYALAMDVRGKDCRWVYENYRDQLNDQVIIVHTNNDRQHPSAAYLRDWGPATKALDWWYNDEAYSRRVYRSMAPCTPVYGWEDPITSDEGLSIKIHSEEGLFQIPSDWMLNLSVHASMGPVLKDKTFTQKVSREKVPAEKGVHYVTFIMSDMDNILTEIGTNSFYSTPKFYANPHRGSFPMSWGMAPALVELSPAGVDLWYENATPNDAFVAYCGLGYFYPNVAPYMQTHMKRLDAFLKRADLRTLLLIDRVLPDREFTRSYYERSAKWFTGLEQIDGLFYMEYVEYAPHGGQIFWFDNKPMVTARFDFRDEQFYPAVRRTPAAMARSINALPKDPSSPDGYTFVTVHAWSRGLDDVYKTIQLLDPDVRVVNAEVFIDMIRRNITPDTGN